MDELSEIISTKYTISEMASLLGVTTHMLRHYEKVGIIQPEVDPRNGYRYYCVVDTRRFNLSRTLLACGISLKQCAEILSNADQESLSRLIAEVTAAKQREIKRMQISINYLQTLEEVYGDLIHRVGQVWTEHFPPMWRLNCSQNEKAVISKEAARQREEWLECLPGVFWVSRIRREIIRTFSDGDIDYEYGLMCYASDAKDMGLKKTPEVEMVPGGDYLVTIHTKTARGPFTWQNIAAATDYLRKENITSFGDAFSHIIASRIIDGEPVNYHKVFLKIYS